MTQIALQGRLERTRLFWRFMLTVEGLLRIGAVCLLLFVACFYLDRQLVLSLEARVHAWQVIGFVAVVGLVGWVFRPVLRRRTVAEMAALVERRFPQLGERLLSAVEFAQAAPSRLTGTSPAMVARLQEEAEQASSRLDFRRAIRSDGLLRALLLFAVSALVLGLHFWVGGPAFGAFLSRMALNNTPVWHDTRVQIEPYPAVKVLKGTSLDVTVRQSGKRELSSRFHYRYSDGRWAAADLRAEADGSFHYHFAALSEPVTFYATAGDGTSDQGRAEVVDPAAIVGATVRLRYPAYLDLPLAVVPGGSGGIAAPAGSTAEVELKASKPIQSAKVTLPEHQPQSWSIAGDRVRGSIPVEKTASYRVEMKDTDGFTAPAQTFPIRMIPDQAPEIELVQPTGSLELVPDARVRLVFRARDDHGVADVKVAYQPEGRPAGGLAIGQGDRHAKSLEGEHSWPLARLGLKAGSIVRYHLEVTDWDDRNGPHVGKTGELQIRIIDRGEAERRYDEDRTQLLQDLKDLTKQQQELHAQAEALRAQPQPNAAALATVAQKQTALGTRASDLARRLGELNQAADVNQLAAPEELKSQRAAEEVLNNVAKQEAPQASGRLDAARQELAARTQAARAQLSEAAQAQAGIVRDLNRATDLLQPGSPLQRFAERFDRLAQEQQALAQQSAKLLPQTVGKSAQELTPAQQQQLGQLSQRQQALQRATNQAVQDLARTAQSLAPVNPNQSTAAQKAAEGLQTAEVPQQQQQAAQNVQQNLLGQAATQQQATAQALQQASRQLQQATAQASTEQAPQSDPLDAARQQVQQLVAQQAAINQGTQRLAQQPHADAAQVKALAQRQAQVQKAAATLPRNLPGPTLQGIARDAQAAMQRSQQGLQTGMPPSAPTRQAQAQALRNLQSLATALDPSNLAAAAQDPQSEQTLAELNALRAQQQALRAETQALNAARPPNQPLMPEQQAQAQALAKEQGQLQAQTAATARRTPGAPLQQAGQHMRQAEGGLRQQQTGAPTQDQQQAAIEALNSAVAQAEQQAQARAAQANQQGRQSGQQKGNRAARKDERRDGSVQNGALASHDPSGHSMTALQPRTQDALRQGYKEKIPADYQDLIKRYYRTLSERAR